MNNSRMFLLFLLVALVQLFVPAKMIFDREKILNSGKEFKFKTAPVDPRDPFRGQYIILSFEENSYTTNQPIHFQMNQTVFVQLDVDKDGFAHISSVSESACPNNNDYIKATVANIDQYRNDSLKISFNYPFDRFYMEEFKAGKAEEVYRESMRDSLLPTYALVSIRDGEAVLKDVVVNNRSISEY